MVSFAGAVDVMATSLNFLIKKERKKVHFTNDVMPNVILH